MKKYLEKSGKTEDEALAAALRELGLDRDDVSVEIIERAKSGFLGIGACPAVVRVEYEAPDEEPAVEESAPVSEPETPKPAEAPKAAASAEPKYAEMCIRDRPTSGTRQRSCCCASARTARRPAAGACPSSYPRESTAASWPLTAPVGCA